MGAYLAFSVPFKLISQDQRRQARFPEDSLFLSFCLAREVREDLCFKVTGVVFIGTC